MISPELTKAIMEIRTATSKLQVRLAPKFKSRIDKRLRISESKPTQNLLTAALARIRSAFGFKA